MAIYKSDEFYRVAFRRKIYNTLIGFQADLDTSLKRYREERLGLGVDCSFAGFGICYWDINILTKNRLLII
jgi:hypothetical protein